MKEKKLQILNSAQEVQLTAFLNKILKHKKFYALSLACTLGLALLYIAFATPQYEVATSILIDPSGSNRSLGESQYVEGGVRLIELEKNLFNEIGIIKSFSLIQETVEELGLNISYHSSNWIRSQEHYGYFPFEVILQEDKSQLYDVPFEVKILSDTEYQLTIKATGFNVSKPSTGMLHEVGRKLDYSQTHKFGQKVLHEYFTYTLVKPDYNMNPNDFSDLDLSFVIHASDEITKDRLEAIEVDNIDIQASIFRLVSVGPLVEKEAAFLNGLTENYMEKKIRTRNEIASMKESFIREQLDIITDSLLQSELKLETFKQGNDAIDLSKTATNAMNRTQRLQTNRAKIQLDIQYYYDMIRYIENNRNSESFILPNASSIEDPLIKDNITELQGLYAERTRKRFYVTADNEEINILNAQIRQSTQKLLTNLNNTVQSSQTLLNGVQAQLSNYDNVINSLPTREKQLLSLQRETTLYENLFNHLSQELAKTGIARAENTSDTQVLDKARMEGNGPVAPQKELLMVLALTLGLLVPTAWVVWFNSDDEIENEDQIRAITSIPLIASVVHYDGDSDTDISLWQVKESFRDISANLRFACTKKNCVIGMTSIMPEEGKTYCAINLGITLAEAGSKTLIIDTDLRKPSLVKSYEQVEGRGLSDYLNGNIKNLQNIIHPHDQVENLSFIPTSVAKGNIHEMLSGDKMRSLFAELRSNYDYIIIDTPAVGLVSDILLLWDLIDINLFVLRRKIAKMGFLKDLENLNQKGKKKKKSFIIFNDALKKDYKYGYGPKYGMDLEKKIIHQTLSVQEK